MMNCKYLLRFDDDLTVEQLRTELQNLANQRRTLKQSNADAYVVQEDSDNELEHSTNPLSITCTSCKSLSYLLLQGAAEVESLYRCLQEHFIGLAYKLLRTLTVSQVTYEYERSFFALRRVKSRLRSTMTQEHLEAFMLMSVEKGILAKLDNKDNIDGVSASSELRRPALLNLFLPQRPFWLDLRSPTPPTID